VAGQLFKLVLSGTTHTVPTVKRYFYKATKNLAITSLAGFTIKKTTIWDDTNAKIPTASFIAQAKTNDGYYMLFIDGVLQQSSMYTVTSANIQLRTTTSNYTLSQSAPITLIVTNFSPTTAINT
jgi:hypothetical protein